MKKLIAAIVIASIGAAFANTVVYDYKASIKRLDLNMKKSTYKINGVKRTGILQSFSVKSDTIQGYVQLQLCAACDGSAVYSSNGELNEGAYAYLTLKGDKYSKVIQRPEYLFIDYDPTEGYIANTKLANSGDYLYVLKTPIEARSAIFGASQALKGDDAGYIINPKQNNKAWLTLDFYMPALGSIGAATYADGTPEDYALQDVETAGRLFKAAADPNGFSLAYLGFLGLGNYGFGSEIPGVYAPTLIQNAGFGTTKTISETFSSEYICIDDWSSTNTCIIINSISGTLVGYPSYAGICAHTPMWDFCYGNEVTDAVISGSWTLKLNSKLTGAAIQEKAILDKFKVNENYLYEIDENGYIVDPTADPIFGNPDLFHEAEF